MSLGAWALGVCAGCAARPLVLPTDAGALMPDFAQIHQATAKSCVDVRTFTAEVAIVGRVGGDRLRGRVLAGFARPASMRLEGIAPFGPPAFILAAREGVAVLLLPREARVVQGASTPEVLGALTGVALGPADLQAILTGCVIAEPKPTGGRIHAGGWASIDLDSAATLYLQRANPGAWQLRAATREGWRLEYLSWQGSFPRTVRLRSEGRDVTVDLILTVSQVEANVELAPEAFTVDVPAGAETLSLQELRNAGPLRGQ